MRVTRFNPLWVSGTTQTYSEVYYGQWTCSPAFQVTVYLSSFRIYPFVTTVVVSKGTETNKFFGFPALSLCNLNAFNTRRFRDLYNGSSNGPFIERYIKDISLMATKSEEILTKEFKSRNIGPFFSLSNARPNVGCERHHEPSSCWNAASKQVSQFHSCSLNAIPCTEKNFTYHISSAYGQCYTFNSAKSDEPMISATLVGQSSGLKLRLNIKRDSYFGLERCWTRLWESVVIHDQKRFPLFMEEFGMIQPNISTLCVIKKKEFRIIYC